MHAFRPTRWLTSAAVLLVLAHVAGQYSARALGHGRVYGLVPLFDLDREANAPAWFFSVLLLGCALLLALVAAAARATGDRHVRRWAVLALIFLVLAADETAQLHDLLTRPIRERLAIDSGYLYFAWVIPAAVLLPVLAVLYLPLLRALPVATRRRFVAAALCYVGGAWGIELIGGRWFPDQGRTVGYVVIITAEEILELTGLLVFFDALARYLGQRRARFTVRFGADPASIHLDAADIATGCVPCPPCESPERG